MKIHHKIPRTPGVYQVQRYKNEVVVVHYSGKIFSVQSGSLCPVNSIQMDNGIVLTDKHVSDYDDHASRASKGLWISDHGDHVEMEDGDGVFGSRSKLLLLTGTRHGV